MPIEEQGHNPKPGRLQGAKIPGQTSHRQQKVYHDDTTTILDQFGRWFGWIDDSNDFRPAATDYFDFAVR